MKTLLTLLVATITACSFRFGPDDIEPGTPVEVVSLDSEEASVLRDELAASEGWSVDEFVGNYRPTFQTLAYEPTDALNLDLIATSSLALDEDELARLSTDGFVTTANEFPSFVYGYGTIYAEDLPVFISADSILFSMHRSYDRILLDVELASLRPALIELIDSMRRRLLEGKALGLTADQETDLDLYLAVAGTLLSDPRQVLVGADQDLVDELVSKAIAAEGSEQRSLFGSERRVDWSHFKPRGHYAGITELEQYFRAMIWLGRIDFRMLEPNELNELKLRRRQLYDTLAMANLLDDASTAQFNQIHDTIGTFVGEPDGLVITRVPALLEALGVEDVTAVKSLSDQEIATAIQKFGFGAQRIASHYMINGVGGTKPLSHSFALMGQRYVLDSHVLSNVVWDRVEQKRMMPDPLDVAFAALKNDQAALLLEPQLREYEYQHALNSVRLLADAHGEDYWSANLYNGWMSAIRALSPSAESPNTEAWGRRILTAQLASWAELRHDTILYAKQSFTAGAACEYPDAYVEPDPDFFAAVVEYAEQGRGALAGNEAAVAYFARLEAAASRLREMASAQRSGEPHGADDLAWINEAVVPSLNCDGTLLGAEGWYGELFYANDQTDFDPTIADVHTQPTDASGNEVGRVLHVGTGNAKALVVTVETCEGPRAYVGLASTYYETVTQDFERLTDEDWAPVVQQGSLVPPVWAP